MVGFFWARSLARPVCAPAWTVAASELLACVAAGGEQELAELAASLGQTPTDLLCNILQQAAEPHVVRAPAQAVPRRQARELTARGIPGARGPHAAPFEGCREPRRPVSQLAPVS